MTASFARLLRAPEALAASSLQGVRGPACWVESQILVPRSGRPGEQPQARPAGCLPSSVLLDTGAPLLP